MILSRACEYGIRAILSLDSRSPEQFVPAKEIARQARLPLAFLAKILGRLAAGGVLESMKGPGGGWRLARPASQITVLEAVQAIDGLGFIDRCVLGFPECNSSTPCPLHDVWGPLRDELFEMLSSKNVHQLNLALSPKGSRLRPKKRGRSRSRTGRKIQQGKLETRDP